MSDFIVKFDKNKCKGCELCITACPKKIIVRNDSDINSLGYNPVEIIKESECIGCANCAIMCPDGVISVYKS